VGLRVSSQGRKTWFVMYRSGGRLRRYTLGMYPVLSLADARAQAAEGAGIGCQAELSRVLRREQDPPGYFETVPQQRRPNALHLLERRGDLRMEAPTGRGSLCEAFDRVHPAIDRDGRQAALGYHRLAPLLETGRVERPGRVPVDKAQIQAGIAPIFLEASVGDPLLQRRDAGKDRDQPPQEAMRGRFSELDDLCYTRHRGDLV
jgi:hypothetical protein